MGKMTYKIDVLDMLKKEGYTQTRLRKEKLIGQDAIQKMRKGDMIGINVLTTVCELLDMQPGDVIKYTK
jgi:putative transcriptional regulator